MSELLDGLSISSLVASVLGGLAWLKYRSAEADYAAIKAATIFSGNAEQLRGLEVDGPIALGIVNGQCRAESTSLKSNGNGIDNAVCMRTVIREVRHVWSKLTNQWDDEKRTISNVTKYIPFCILTNSCAVSVREPLTMDELEMPTKTVIFEPRPLNLLGAVSMIFKGEEVKGVEVLNEALIEGTEVTAVGELRKCGSFIELGKPKKGLPHLMLASSVTGLLRQYEDKISPWKKISISLAIVASGLFCVWFAKRLKGLLRWYLERRQRAALDSISVDQVVQEATNNLLCAICFDKPRNTLMLPCGHFCSCDKCAVLLHTCPICRGNIDSKLPFHNV